MILMWTTLQEHRAPLTKMFQDLEALVVQVVPVVVEAEVEEAAVGIEVVPVVKAVVEGEAEAKEARV